MATGVSIGPRIGIEGAAEFQRQLRTCAAEVKKFQSEIDKSTSSFKESGNALEHYSTKQKNIINQMKSLNSAITIHNEKIKSMSEAWGDQATWTETQKQQFLQTETALNKNITAYQDLERELKDLSNQVPTVFEQINQKIEESNDRVKRYAESFAQIGRDLTKYLTLPIMAGIGGSVKAAADWETGLTGVKKTVDEVVDSNGNLLYSYNDLDKAFREVAKSSVISYDELLSVGEIAGQLGISADKVAEFSDIMLKLGASTNMTSEEAATNIAKILNITNKGMPYTIGAVEKFADVLVDLGNNFATTEGDITSMATRLASAGTIAGLTTQDILALSTAMSAAGIRAEAGGSSFSQVLVNLEKRVAKFSSGATDELDTVARLAGMTADEFAKSWKKKPIEAISAFIKGLSELDEQAESTSLVLEELDMDGIRQSNTLKALSLAYPMLVRALGSANKQWSEGGALMTEYGKRAETFDSKMQNLKNNLGILGLELGETLLPTLERLVEGFTELIKSFQDLPDGIQKAIIDFGLLLATIGPLITIGSKAIIMFSNLKIAMGVLKGGAVAKEIGLLSGALGKVGTEGIAGASGIDKMTTALGSGSGGLFGAMTKFLNNPVVQKGGIASLILYAGYAAFNFEEEVENWKTSLEGFGTFLEGLGKGTGDLIAKFFGYENWDEASAALDEGTSKLKEGIQTWSEETFGPSGVTKGAMDNLLADAHMTEEELERIAKQKKIMIAANEDDLGNQLRVINERTSKEVVAENQKRFEVVNTAVKGYKTSTIKDFEDTEQGMINAINTNKPKVSSAMQQTAKDAQSPITALKSVSSSWGSDLISGFVRGIKSMYSAVTSAVSGIAGIVSSWLHFSRPDVGPLREYEKWMPDFMQGLADGINSNAWRVEDAMSNLSADMALNVTGTTKPLANQSSFNYGGVVINLNVPEGANGRMLVDEIEAELANRTIRRKAVF